MMIRLLSAFALLAATACLPVGHLAEEPTDRAGNRDWSAPGHAAPAPGTEWHGQPEPNPPSFDREEADP